MFLCLISNTVYALTDLEKTQALASAKDYLGLRIQLIKIYNQPLSFKDWVKYRRLIYDQPQVGYDIIFAWDQHKKVNNIPSDAAEKKYNLLLKKPKNLLIKKTI